VGMQHGNNWNRNANKPPANYLSGNYKPKGQL
jgi:hypothetical protein